MYMIEFLIKNKELYKIICDQDSLFHTTWMLNESPYIYQFKVSQGAMTCNQPKEFGFGKFEKWVNKFEYNK